MSEAPRGMKPWYPMAQALADLRAAGLLQGVLMARAGRLEAVAPSADLPPETGFAGAGLDSRSLAPGNLFVALPGRNVDGRRFIAAAAAAGHWSLAGREPGSAGERPLDPATDLLGIAAQDDAGVLVCTDGAAALAHLAARHRDRWSGVMVGVTGTNGKTTCKDLCAAMLAGAGGVLATRANFNNRLGVPLTLLDLAPDHRYAVLEMGASAVGHIASLAALVRPRVGVITNAGRAHLAEFGSLAGVITGKGELLDALPPDGTAVLNADSPGFTDWVKRTRCRVESWGERAGDHRWRWRPEPGKGWFVEIDGRTWPVPMPGRHNGANLTAAVLAVRAAGIGEDAARSGLAGFRPSPHRGSLLRWEGRLLLDDSYNANPVSMQAAAEALVELAGSRPGVAVLGAMAELGPESDRIHRETGTALHGTGLGAVVAVGGDAEPLGRGFDAQGGEAHYCPDHQCAARWIRTMTRPGDVILLKGSRSAAMERVLDHLPGVVPASEGA